MTMKSSMLPRGCDLRQVGDGYYEAVVTDTEGNFVEITSYDNRFVSIVTIKNRKIVRWRDYMDSLAAWQALTGK